MRRRNFIRAMFALPVVGGMAACGKGEPEAAAPGPKLEPTWLVEYDDDGGNLKTFLGMFPETESGYARAMAIAILADAVLPRWTRFNLPIQLGGGRVIRGLDLPLDDLNKLSTP